MPIREALLLPKNLWMVIASLFIQKIHALDCLIYGYAIAIGLGYRIGLFNFGIACEEIALCG